MCSRWEEELIIRREESRRIPASFRKDFDQWKIRANLSADATLPRESRAGYIAYAHKKAAMYKNLAELADLEHREVCSNVLSR